MSYNLNTYESSNDYINFGKSYIIKKNKLYFNLNDLSKLTNNTIAIDTEGRYEKTNLPIMIQITDGKKFIILKYQKHRCNKRVSH